MGNSQSQSFSVYPEMRLNHLKLSLLSNDLPQTIQEYLKEHVGLKFYGQSSKKEDTDYSSFRKSINLASVLCTLDGYIHESDVLKNPTAHDTDEIFIELIKLLANCRKHNDETVEMCFNRLKEQSKFFLEVYRNRAESTEKLIDCHYWGSKQQLLAGKVVADWVDPINGPLDPVFGVLLVPCAGRVGPGNSSFLHNILFDNNGYLAHHSAVHDAFGYLQSFHNIGPGYDYLHQLILSKTNMFAGQITGILFWRSAISEFEETKTASLKII